MAELGVDPSLLVLATAARSLRAPPVHPPTEAMKAFGSLSMAATASKAIDSKTKELMALAIGVAIHCDGCVAFHTKMAHQQGATRDEVVETVALAVYMGGGPAAVYGADAVRAYDQFSGKS